MKRTILFVPGNRPDRFDKACASAADLVCIDLEDAVAPQDKASARDTVIAYLSGTPHNHVSLRINASDTEYCQDDIKALSKADLNLPYVMMPKVGDVDDIKMLDKSL
ncbi:MAG: CoA ester lyase, partial [Hellea sp.]|nr:CoA ester lyase [Hellea sp.]